MICLSGCTAGDLEMRARENLKNPKYLESLNVLGIDINDIIEKQKEYYYSLERWSNQFMSDCHTDIDFKIGQEKDDDYLTSAHIDNVIDIEENIWSPYYGLKGKMF